MIVMPNFSGLLLLTVLAGLTVPAAPASADQKQQLGKLASTFRRYRTSPRRRADAVKQLAAAGTQGIATAEDLIGKELERLATGVVGPAPTAPLDEKIEQLRKVLAKLRADEALTQQKIKQIGLPTLNRLIALCRQRQSEVLRHRTKYARTLRQLEQFAEFLRLVEAEWQAEAAPLPVKDYLEQTGQLLGKIVDRDYEEAQRIMAQNAKLAQRFDPNAMAGMRGLNQLRVICGLGPLAVDLKLCQAATGHSADMRLHKFFSHESPLPGKRTFQDRAKKAGTTASGENIYTGSISSASAVKAWFLSPGHHKNMLGDKHRRQGLGHSGKYWTHLFGR